MPSLADALKDKRGFADDLKINLNGVEFSLGELRQFQEATGQDVAKQLEADRQKLVTDQAALTAAQEEVVKAWEALQKKSAAAAPAAPSGTDWRTDPFFAPVAQYLEKDVLSKITDLSNNYAQIQKALGLGVKYIADVISEQRYQMLPEDYRKEVSYADAVKIAAEKKFLDSGGVPDIRKAYEEWRTPRERKAEEERIRKEAYESARTDLMKTAMPRPGGVAAPPPDAGPDAPHNLKEAFNKLKEDPEFLRLYTGQVQ